MVLTLLVLTAGAAGERDESDWLAKIKGVPYRYAGSGRRDPFLFMIRSKEVAPIDSSERVLDLADRIMTELLKPPEGGSAKEATLPAVGATIGTALAELHKGNFENAKNLAEHAQRKISEEHSAELVQMVERVHRASVILTRRKEVEQDFRKLSLRVDAIFWKSEEPVAIINGHTRHEGDVLDDQLQIYKIEKSGVVFLYKFMKVRKRLGWRSGSSRR